MKSRRSTRFLSLLLCILMCVSLLPAEVFAESEDSEDLSTAEEIATLPEDTADETVTETPETADPASDSSETEEPSQSPAPPAEETTEDPAEVPAAEDDGIIEGFEEEDEDVESPEAELYPFPGLGEGVELTEEQLAAKTKLAAEISLEALAQLEEGKDYAAGELIAVADTEEQAYQIAEAYDADLEQYSDGLVIMKLRNATVLEAMTAAVNPDTKLPAVDPDYYAFMGVTEESEPAADVELESSVPVKQSWQSWYESSASPDTYLSNPHSSNFQWMHDMVNTFEAWGVTTGRSAIKVAVIGTGVQTNHPELSGRVTAVNSGNGTSVYSGQSTIVAGIIAASANNGAGGAGIAPGVSIVSIRAVNSSGEITVSTMTSAINYAISNGVDIIDISGCFDLYSSSLDSYVQKAIKNNNITVIASTGDYASNFKSYPAALDNVIGVAAVDENGNRASFTSYGSWVDVSAPGVNIESCTSGSSYSLSSSTANAAAVVSGVAALYMSKVGRQSPDIMASVLKSAVNKCSSSEMGAGIIDASKLFTGDKTAPVITLKDESGYTVSASDGLSAKGKIYMTFGNSVTDTNRKIVYTIDGKNPSIADGQLTNGYVYSGAITPYLIADVGQTVTIKAAVVSGMGVMSNVTTVKVKILASAQPTSITILTAGVVEAASGITMKATVEPEYASQEVIWSVESSSPYQWTIAFDKNGKLTFPQNYSGTVKIRATSAVKKTVYKEATLKVNSSANSPTSKITLQSANVSTLGTGTLSATAYITFANGTMAYSLSKTHTSGVMCEWTSSKTSVAEVDEYGTITGVGVGTTTITCRALDGTNKKASIKITFRRAVDAIALSGQDSIAPGCSATYKVTVIPSNAANKKVTWSLSSAPSGVTIDSKSGKVTVAAWKTSGSFKVNATTTDGTNITASKTVSIRAKTTSLRIATSSSDYGVFETYKNNSITEMTLYTINPINYSANHSNNKANTATLQAYTSTGASVTITSDKPSVATVSSGKITAVSAGKAKITCAANDGSGKKVTFTVNVVVPVSTLYVTPQLTSVDGYYHLGFGKSCSFAVTAGDTYGKPTNTKVTWGFSVYRRVWNSSSSSYSTYDITSMAQNNGYVKISNGKLTVSKNMQSYWVLNSGEIYVKVTAYTTDGTNLSTTSDPVYLHACVSSMSAHLITNYKASTGTIMYEKANLQGGKLSLNSAGQVFIKVSSYYLKNFTVTSSNPNVCSAYVLAYTDDGLVVNLDGGLKKGTAKITVKANDGSGKSCSFNAVVK